MGYWAGEVAGCQELGRWALTMSAFPSFPPAMKGSRHWTARAGSSCEVPPAAHESIEAARASPVTLYQFLIPPLQ